MRSVILAAAAVLVPAAAAAADVPAGKAAPVEFVRVCSTYGTGFFTIPGTGTCMRVGGRARYEFQVSQSYSRGDNATGSRAIGRVYLDARTATEFGLLRAFVRVDAARRMGAVFSGTAQRMGTGFVGTGVDYGAAETQVTLDRAFIQLGGLTAGRTQSFFGFYQGDLEFVGTTAGQSPINNLTNLLAYTATFGGGFSATLSLEDPVETRNGIVNALSGPLAPAGTTLPAAGASMPDAVLALRYDAAWGAAQVSGVVHQVRAVGQTCVAGLVNGAGCAGGSGPAVGFAPGTEFGYGFNAGVKVNLPMLAAGDQLWLQGTWTKGAPTYVTGNYFGLGKVNSWGIGQVAGVGLPDAVATGPGPGNLQLPTTWGLTAAVLHYWTPTVRQALFGSYIGVNYGAASFAATNGPGFNPANQYRDWTYWTVGTNVIWSPVQNLDIGLEVNYLHMDAGQGGVNSTVPGDPTNLVRKSDSQVVTRLRIQRDF